MERTGSEASGRRAAHAKRALSALGAAALLCALTLAPSVLTTAVTPRPALAQTAIPTEIFVVLATNAGKVLTHRFLLERVWGGYAAGNAQQLRVYINYLRRKLEPDPAHPTLIVTDPGVGYRLRG